jgi:hypothetical protein
VVAIPLIVGVGLLGVSSPSDDVAEVAAAELEVFAEPDEAGFVTGLLRRGDRVRVRGELDDGWLEIDPPRGAFDWIDRDAVAEEGRGRARVVAPRAVVRAGRPGARMPGPPGRSLEEGATVRLLDRPPLALRQGRSRRSWLAIVPPAGERRFVRAEGLREDEEDDDPPRTVARASERVELTPTIDPSVVSIGPPAPREGHPSAFARALAGAESEHHAALRRPVESWDLEAARRRYQALLDGTSDPSAQDIVRMRLGRLEQQQRVAKAARGVRDQLDRSRQIDADVADSNARVEDSAARPKDQGFDAEGLLQPSSRQLDGRFVFALIGKDGKRTAFLDVPPGLETAPLMARKVGVRGTIGYSEDLDGRVIRVRDLVPLSDPP